MKQTHQNRRCPVVGIMLAMYVLVAGAAFAGGNAEEPDTVTVVGQGTLSVEPDQATVTVGVQLYHEDAQVATTRLASRMQAVIDAISAMNIPDERIMTTNYSVYFERTYQGGQGSAVDADGEPQGSYRVENMVRVTITDVARVAEVVEAAIEAGANQLYGVEFSLSDPEAHEAEARELAMDDARRRAEEFAAAVGRTVGEVAMIAEQPGGYVGPMEARAMSMGGGAGPVQPGRIPRSAQVRVTYRLK